MAAFAPGFAALNAGLRSTPGYALRRAAVDISISDVALRHDFAVANLQRTANRSSARPLVDKPVDCRWKDLAYAG